MHFTLYTSKTVTQCARDLTERLEAKPTKTRPALGGWVEKKQRAFSVTITAPVIARIKRTTRLTASFERERGTTVIQGHVSDGVSPFWTRVLLGVVFLLALLLLIAGEVMLALVLVLFAGAAYIPLHGDYINSDSLLIEVEKTLKASPKPPKK
jgi:hypothetical protein